MGAAAATENHTKTALLYILSSIFTGAVHAIHLALDSAKKRVKNRDLHRLPKLAPSPSKTNTNKSKSA